MTKIQFKQVCDKRFEKRVLMEAKMKGNTTLDEIRSKVTTLTNGLIEREKNNNVRIGVAYKYAGFRRWMPAMLTDITTFEPDNTVPLFIETNSGQEVHELVDDDDTINEYRIYLIKGSELPDAKRPDPKKSKSLYKTPNYTQFKEDVTRAVFDKKKK